LRQTRTEYKEMAMKVATTREKLPAFAAVRLRATSVLVALMFTALALPTQAQVPSITATPNPVPAPAGQTSGTTTLVWDGGDDHPYAEVWQQIDNNDETFVVESGKGTRQMTVEVGKTYIFRLSDAGELLASVTVTAKNEPVPPPPGGGGGGAGVVLRPRRSDSMMTPGPVEHTAPPSDPAIYVAYITDTQAVPRGGAVTVTFWTSPRVTPMVEIGQARPVQADGRWIFPAGQSIGQGTALASQRTGPLSRKIETSANTFYTFDSTQANISSLEPGTTYHYIISVPKESGSSYNQTTGNFTTLSQTVKVFFDAVKIVNDSDPDFDDIFPPPPDIPDAGEIDLWFWINHSDPSAKGHAINRFNDNSALTDHFYDLKKEFVIENAPRTLTLSVSGLDHDGVHTIYSGRSVPPPLDGPNDSGLTEENVAKDEWDLTRFPTAPGETYRQEFKLVSMPNGGNKGDLSFEVYGHWEITRSQP
jgi:hypothetical protein